MSNKISFLRHEIEGLYQILVIKKNDHRRTARERDSLLAQNTTLEGELANERHDREQITQERDSLRSENAIGHDRAANVVESAAVD